MTISNSQMNQEELSETIEEMRNIDAQMELLKNRRAILADKLDLHYGFSSTTAGSKTYEKRVNFKRNVREFPDTKRIRQYLLRAGYSAARIDEIMPPQEPKLSKTEVKGLPKNQCEAIMKMIAKSESSVTVKVLSDE